MAALIAAELLECKYRERKHQENPMIISDLNHMSVVAESTKVEGGWSEYDRVTLDFNSYNSFNTSVNSPYTLSNSAAAGAKGSAVNNTCYPTASFTKADTVAATEFLGGSLSGSTSVAVINPYC